jgi:hypothetical protein
LTKQLPNGTQEIRYTLIACTNDVRAGGGMIPGLGFRFVPGTNVTAEVQPVVVPAPAPAPAPAPTPAPAPVVAEPATATADAGTVTFEFRKQTNGQPSMVRLRGIEVEDFTFDIGPTVTTLRYRTATAQPVETQN